MNVVILSGRLGRDPEIRFTKTGQKVITVSMATNRRGKLDDGSYGQVADWHNLVAYGDCADFLEMHCKKGSAVDVIGELRTRKWMDREGNNRYVTEVLVNKITFSNVQSSEDGQTAEKSKPQSALEDKEEDMPF